MSTFMPKSEKALLSLPLDVAGLQKLKTMWDSSYDLEINSNVTDERALYQEGDLKAYGILKSMAEAVIVLDKNSSKRTQIESLRCLYQHAISSCKEKGIVDLHAFTSDEKYADILIKKFGFARVKGIPLVLDLR